MNNDLGAQGRVEISLWSFETPVAMKELYFTEPNPTLIAIVSLVMMMMFISIFAGV